MMEIQSDEVRKRKEGRGRAEGHGARQRRPGEGDDRRRLQGELRRREVEVHQLDPGRDEEGREAQQVSILAVPAYALSNGWGLVRDWLLNAIERGGDEQELHVLTQLADTRYQLWIILRDGVPVAGVITELFQRAARRMVILRYAGGEDLDFWAAELNRELEKFGRANGAEGIELHGRKGFEATVDRLGFNEAHRTFRRLFDG